MTNYAELEVWAACAAGYLNGIAKAHPEHTFAKILADGLREALGLSDLDEEE